MSNLPVIVLGIRFKSRICLKLRMELNCKYSKTLLICYPSREQTIYLHSASLHIEIATLKKSYHQWKKMFFLNFLNKWFCPKGKTFYTILASEFPRQIGWLLVWLFQLKLRALSYYWCIWPHFFPINPYFCYTGKKIRLY